MNANPSELPRFRLGMTIDEMGEEGNRYIRATWKPLYDSMYEQLSDAFLEIEDAAYGMFLDRLMPPLFERLKEAGFEMTAPIEEQDFVIGQCLIFRNSLEQWGSEANRSRIFWTVISRRDDEPIGALLTEIPHSHLQFDIPAAPRLYALKEDAREPIVRAIRQLKGQ